MIAECNHPVNALSVAAACGHDNCVEILLRSGARADLKVGSGGFTPLYLASQAGHETAISLLLAAHPDVEARRLLLECQTADGATPLMVGCHMGHVAVVNRLLAEGADTVIRVADGRVLVAADVASAAGNTECAALVRACEEYRSFGSMAL
eukprot:2485905-Prymnesium_polylepis.1